MRISFTFGADARAAQGKGASRRLRHSGKVPAILYGGGKEAQPLMLDQRNLLTMIDNERFYSSIVRLQINGSNQEAIVKDIQMHPARNLVLHVDLQRVLENEQIRIQLPIHFKGEAQSPGVKTQGGVVSHMRADVEVVCLPKDLPEFLELDISGMNINETKFLGDVPLPQGVTIPELAHRNAAVVSIHSPRAQEEAAPAEGAAAAATAEGAAPAAAAAPAAEAKKGEEKKDAAGAKKEAGGAAKKEGGKK
jgi:large subunit ribosomal protein L25